MDERTYEVVVDARHRYSLWPVDLPLPPGWSATERAGTESECLDYIAAVWTDLGPRSLGPPAAST
jgi:MbtH protein